MLNNVLTTNYEMVRISKSVKINETKVKEVANKLKNLKFEHWIVSEKNRILNLPIENQINFLLVFDSINCSFWGNPKWTVKLDSGENADGSFALMEKLLDYYEKNDNLDFTKVTYDEFSEILEGNVEIPLLAERYNIVYEVSNIVNEKMNGNFYKYIKDVTSDIELFNIIISNFKSFEDVRIIGGRKIYFYKLAQLLVSDILHLRKYAENIEIDVSNLVGCSDYKIPQILRGLGVIEYADELAVLVDNKKVIGPNSKFEVEIRSATIVSIDKIKKELENKFSSIEVNDLLWELSHDKSINLNPYHLTRTLSY